MNYNSDNSTALNMFEVVLSRLVAAENELGRLNAAHGRLLDEMDQRRDDSDVSLSTLVQLHREGILPAEALRAVIRAVHPESRIEQIKALRGASGEGLKVAKDFMEGTKSTLSY